MYIYVWLHVHAETFMANRWRHAVSVTFFSPRITHPRVTDLPSRAKLQIKRPTLTIRPMQGKSWYDMVVFPSDLVDFSWWKNTMICCQAPIFCWEAILPWWHAYGFERTWSNEALAAMLQFGEGNLRFFEDFFSVFKIYILFYKFARTINLWTLQRLLRLWKNRSSTASSFRENPGLLGLNQGRMMGWLKYFEVLHLRCKP